MISPMSSTWLGASLCVLYGAMVCEDTRGAGGAYKYIILIQNAPKATHSKWGENRRGREKSAISRRESTTLRTAERGEWATREMWIFRHVRNRRRKQRGS